MASSALQFNGGKITVALLDNCEAQAEDCSLGGREIAALFIETILLLVYAALCLRYQICAHADHSRFLPYTRYRLSNIYIRVQVGVPPVSWLCSNLGAFMPWTLADKHVVAAC